MFYALCVKRVYCVTVQDARLRALSSSPSSSAQGAASSASARESTASHPINHSRAADIAPIGIVIINVRTRWIKSAIRLCTRSRRTKTSFPACSRALSHWSCPVKSWHNQTPPLYYCSEIKDFLLPFLFLFILQRCRNACSGIIGMMAELKLPFTKRVRTSSTSP